MNPLQITLIAVASGLAYLTMSVVVGATLTARITRYNLSRGLEWIEDQRWGVALGSIFWVGGLAYLAWMKLTEVMVCEDQGKKCILCGTKNATDSAHCKHCGNLMGAETGL